MPRAASIRRFATPTTQRQVGMFLQKAKLNGNKTETNSPSRMRRGGHRSPRGLRISVSLALSHGGPDGGSLRFTARKAKLKTKGPNCVSKYNEGPQRQPPPLRGCVVIMRSMTYWHDGGGPGGLLGTFPQFLGRHCGQGNSQRPHTWPHYFPQHNTR